MQTFKKSTTNIQNASISDNEKKNVCHIKKKHPEEVPEYFRILFDKVKIKTVYLSYTLPNCDSNYTH